MIFIEKKYSIHIVPVKQYLFFIYSFTVYYNFLYNIYFFNNQNVYKYIKYQNNVQKVKFCRLLKGSHVQNPN